MRRHINVDMVNPRDASLIAVDVALSLVAERVSGDATTLKNAIVQNTFSSTIYHYALRPNVNAALGGSSSSITARAAAKGAVLVALKALHYWADDMKINWGHMLAYGASQAVGELAQPSVVALLGLVEVDLEEDPTE